MSTSEQTDIPPNDTTNDTTNETNNNAAESSDATTESDSTPPRVQSPIPLLKEIDNAFQLVEARFAQLWLTASTTASGVSSNLEAQKHDLTAQLESLRDNLAKSVSGSNATILVELVREQISEIEKKIPALSAVHNLANTALDKLDEGLESVERTAGRYVSSFKSFFSSIVLVEPSTAGGNDKENLSNAESSDTSHAASLGYGPGRFQSELYRLHTTSLFYVTEPKGDCAAINVGEKTAEISTLLAKYPELKRLMREVVPEKVDYNTFWERYFFQHQQLTEAEEKRTRLLQQSKEEDFNWDDDDEEEEEEEGDKTLMEKLSLEGGASPDTPSATSSSKDPKPKTESHEDEEDEDWE